MAVTLKLCLSAQNPAYRQALQFLFPWALRYDAAMPVNSYTLSCVVPAYNEAQNLPKMLPQLHAQLSDMGMAFEILVVNDGSRDATQTVLQQLCSALPHVRALNLSRNFGKEAALTAGLDAAQGDAVVLMDADLQHSPHLLPQMVQHWLEGAEVVYAVRENRDDESFLKKLGTKLFYNAVNRGVRFRFPEDAGDFRLMDRRVVQALRRLPERNRFMKGLYAWAGFKAVALPYTPQARDSGQTNYNIFKLFHFAIDGLTAFTSWPLRMVTVLGLLAAFGAFLYGSWVIVQYLFWGNPVSGWSTLVVCILLFSGLQMLSIGILGEYIARIFEEVKRRPVYIVAQEHGKGLPRRKRQRAGSLSANTDSSEMDDMANEPAAQSSDL